MLRAPFWTRAAHVVPFGAIGIADKIDQPAPVNPDIRDGAEQYLHKQHGGFSVQFAEHG